MSPLLVTLFAGVHTQLLTLSMSLLPTVYVDESLVSKTVEPFLTFVLKSWSALPAVKPLLRLPVIGMTLFGSWASLGPIAPPGPVPLKNVLQSLRDAACAFPSSSNARSCAASALGMNSTAAAIAAIVVHRKSQRLRRLPVGPITVLANLLPPLPPARRRAAA